MKAHRREDDITGMSQTAAASREYLKNAVLTARPEQLQIMLLDGAIRFSAKGREALEAKNYEESFNNLDRAQRICAQLGDGLNREINPELVDMMRGLYNFCYTRLIDANLRHETKAVDDAVRILRHQRETWQLIADRIAAGDSPAEAMEGAPMATAPRPSKSNSLRLAPDAEAESSINFQG
jgi:flagellar protein FliS